MTKKYPIGTRIRFLNKNFDTGLTGTIVGFSYDDKVDIFLPGARKHMEGGYYPTLPDGTKFTWHCKWDEIELLFVEGEQLLFSFMNTMIKT